MSIERRIIPTRVIDHLIVPPTLPLNHRDYEDLKRIYNQKVFLLRIGGEILGSFYVTSTSCTLTWNGVIDFSRLDIEVLEYLRMRVLGTGLQDRESRNFSLVSFIIADDLVHFDLKDHDQYQRYKRILQMAMSSSFVRYDAYLNAQYTIVGYSFTAENRHSTEDQGNELALQLPRNQKWSRSLVRWILDHHHAAQHIKREMDIEGIVAKLTGLANS